MRHVRSAGGRQLDQDVLSHRAARASRAELRGASSRPSPSPVHTEPLCTAPDPEQVFVRGTMLKPTKSSRFFSVKSFFSGFKNNLLGMVGFAKEGPLSRKGKVRATVTRAACSRRGCRDATMPLAAHQEVFNDRINAEREIAVKVAARKAAKAAQAGKEGGDLKAR